MSIFSAIQPILSLPSDFDDILQEAMDDDHHYMARMQEEWQNGINCFDKPGEQYFLIQDLNGATAAMGGINIDPYANDPEVGRLRHVYVKKQYRRNGLATQIVRHIEMTAAKAFKVLHLRTHNKDARKLYISLGFNQINHSDPSHYYFEKSLR